MLAGPARRGLDRPGQGRQELGPEGVLEGHDVLTGFPLPVDEVFGWLVAEE